MLRMGSIRRGLSLALVLSVALALGGCEDDKAKSETITLPPYNNTGQLDTTFGGTGFIATNSSPLAAGDDRAWAVTTDGTGNVVVAGYIFNSANEPDFGVWRLNSVGTRDVGFNGGMPFFRDLPGAANWFQEARSIAIQSDGNIVLAGFVNAGANDDPVVWRIFASGAGVDTAFNGTGFYAAPPPGSVGNDRANAVAIDSAGRIVVAGTSDQGPPNGNDMVVWRFNSDGTLDTTFATSGIFRTQTAANEAGLALAIDGSNNIFVAGSLAQDIAVWKLLGTNGALDSAFNTNGVRTYVSTTGADQAQSIVLDGSGRVVVAGSIFNGTDDDAAVLRLTSAGAPDSTFGTAGVKTFSALAGGTAGPDVFNGAAIDALGRIVLTGTSLGVPGNANDMILVRLTASGTLDTSFAGGGIAIHHNAAGNNGDDFGNAVTIDSNGRIVVAGYSQGNPAFNFAVWRYR